MNYQRPDEGIFGKKIICKKKTNAMRIRSMTDEELAEFLRKIDKGYDSVCGNYAYLQKGVVICGRDDFGEQILKWLQSEAE